MSSSTPGSKPSVGWQPPSLEEMQAMLPNYRFECLLGRGGMGAVYKAMQASLDRPVAIKVLPGDLIDDTDAQFAERFKNEARTMAKMNHPGIVNVFDFGETQTGLLYFVMEFINGTDVAQMITSQGKLPEDYALSITAHVCDALAYAHNNGIIHRDIKPANILINQDGSVKVADFGLAKQSDAGQSGLTKTNMAMGTPDFVAPEALIPGIPLDGRADLYAIGVMLYQMLTGEIPRGIWSLPGAKLGTDPRFDAIITKAMQTDREVRYQTAAEIRQELDGILRTPRAALIAQQQAAAEATARATQAQKQAASGPQSRNPGQSVRHAPPPVKQSNSGLFIGIAATLLLGAGLVFFPFSKEPKLVPKTNASIPAEEPETNSNKPPVRQKDIDAPAVASPPSSSRPGAINLLAGLDVAKNKRQGDWKLVSGELISDTRASESEITLPVASVPAEYDLRYHLTRFDGYQMQFRFPHSGRMTSFVTDGWTGNKKNNNEVEVKWGGSKPGTIIRPKYLLRDGKAHELVMQVRANGIVAMLDGQVVIRRDSGNDGSAAPELSIRVARGKVIFHAIQLIPITSTPSSTMVAEAGKASTPLVKPSPPVAQPATASPAMTSSSSTPPVAAITSPADFKSGAVHTFGGHRYQLINEELTWDAAKARAESMGGHLATITSKEERDWLTQSLSLLKGTCSHVVLGGYRPPAGGPWSWVTGEAFDMALWPGNPPKTTDPHLAFYMAFAQWDDTPPKLKVPLLVEWDRAELLAAHPQLSKLEAGFRSRHDADAQKPYLAALATLNQSYVTNGISRARSATQAKGSLAEVTALDAEKAALEKGVAVPLEDTDSTPAALKTLRTTYRAALAKITAERDAKAAPLYDLYFNALDTYIADLTKTGKLADARHVSALRAEIVSQMPQKAAAPVVTTPPATTKPVTAPATAPTASPNTADSTGSIWRTTAEFLVNNGGSFVASKSGSNKTVKTAAEIPSGKFDIIELSLDRLGYTLPPLKNEDLLAFTGLRDLRRVLIRPAAPGLSDAAFAFLIGNDELDWLNLEGVRDVTDAVLLNLVSAKKLNHLAISAPKFTGQGLEKLPCASTLASLELLGSGISAEGVKAICTFKALQHLQIDSGTATDRDFAQLSALRSLTNLNLRSTAFGDEAAEAIAALTGLTQLNLSRTKLTDAGLAKLHALKKLNQINLNGTEVSPQAAADFQKALPNCRVNR